MDSFTTDFAATLPSGRELDAPVTYQFLSEDEVADVCQTEGAVCANDGVVYSYSAVDLHELVHAVRQRAYGNPLPGPSVLEEGLAVSYFSADSDSRRFGHLGLPVLADAGNRLVRDDYPAAGHFASFMLALNGEAGYHDFVSDSANAQKLSDLANPYGTATGRELGPDLDDYYASPDCPMFAFTSRPVECGDEPDIVLQAGEPDSLEMLEFSCESPGALGPSLGRVWSYLVIENPTTLSLPFWIAVESSTAEPDDMFRADVAPCGAGCPENEASYAFLSESGGAVYLEMEPGRSILRFAVSAGVVADLVVTFTPEGGAGVPPAGSPSSDGG